MVAGRKRARDIGVAASPFALNRAVNSSLSRPTPHRADWIALALLAMLFAGAWGMAARVAASRSLVAPADLDYRPEAATSNRVLALQRGDRFLPPFMLSGGSIATLALPADPAGFELTMVSWKRRRTSAPDVAIAVNGAPIGNLAENGQKRWNHVATHGARLRVPGMPAGTDAIRLTVAPRPHETFNGCMMLTPRPALAAGARLALPAAAWLLLALLAWRFAAGRAGWLFPIGLALTLFAVYLHALSSAKLMPFADYFFSDSLDFVLPVTQGLYTYDMTKHPLFQPVARALYRVLRIAGTETAAMSAVFPLLGAANALLAWGWLRRWCIRPRSAALLALLYGFTFSVWVFASHFETYILASVVANLFLLVLLLRDRMRWWTGAALQALTGAAAGLAHPPLLILGVVAAIRQWRRAGPRIAAREALVLLVVLLLFVTGGLGLRRASGPMAEQASAPSVPGRGLFAAEAQSFRHYAQPRNRTLFQVGNVVAGQAAFALAGLPHPCYWADGLAGLRPYLRTISGTAAAAGLACVWVLGLTGLVRDPTRRHVTLHLLAWAGAPYLLFFWAFNPTEMFLYAVPLVGALLGWLLRGWERLLGPRVDYFLLTLAAVFVWHNGLCLATYP